MDGPQRSVGLKIGVRWVRSFVASCVKRLFLRSKLTTSFQSEKHQETGRDGMSGTRSYIAASIIYKDFAWSVIRLKVKKREVKELISNGYSKR